MGTDPDAALAARRARRLHAVELRMRARIARAESLYLGRLARELLEHKLRSARPSSLH